MYIVTLIMLKFNFILCGHCLIEYQFKLNSHLYVKYKTLNFKMFMEVLLKQVDHLLE